MPNIRYYVKIFRIVAILWLKLSKRRHQYCNESYILLKNRIQDFNTLCPMPSMLPRVSEFSAIKYNHIFRVCWILKHLWNCWSCLILRLIGKISSNIWKIHSGKISNQWRISYEAKRNMWLTARRICKFKVLVVDFTLI